MPDACAGHLAAQGDRLVIPRGGNLGAGVNIPLAGRFEALLTADYHMTIGYLRSFEEWGLNEVVPIQFLSINIGVTF